MLRCRSHNHSELLAAEDFVEPESLRLLPKIVQDTRNKNHDGATDVERRSLIMVQKLTHFFTQVSKNESFQKGIAAAGAGALIAVITELVWGES